jgi:hypothetical protein
MVLLASAYDQSNHLRAEDVPHEKKLRIKKVTPEMVGNGDDQEEKLVVWFTNDKRGLPLNKTNNRTLRGAFGDDTAGWVGHLIVVYRMQTSYKGKPVPGLRVRILPPKQAQGKPAVKPVAQVEPEDELLVDEEIDEQPEDDFDEE